jgi:hypothetical protein
MDVETSVRLSPEEETQLAGILGVEANHLNARMAALGRAALREYVDMLLGQSTLRNPENREHRLLLMILEAFGGDVPTEAAIGRMFNLTSTGASALSRSVLARHRLRLGAAVRTAATNILQNCGEEIDGVRRASVTNPAMIDYLNQVLVQSNGALKRIARERGTGTHYLIPEDSYLALAAEFLP